MNASELARRVAEVREPIASLEAIPHAVCPPVCNVDHDLFPDVSEHRNWALRTRPEWHWQPRPIDDSYAVMLLRELHGRFPYFCMRIKDSGIEFEGSGVDGNLYLELPLMDTIDAIVTAWLAVFEKRDI